MLVKTIKYVDYDGNEREEKFYFNLSKAELAEMELSYEGGMKKHLERMIDEKDNRRLVEHFKNIILGSYGVKSEDGKRFIKSDELSTSFSQTEAYSNLFLELLSSETDAAANFINGIIPQV